jgi:hypothetical protein
MEGNDAGMPAVDESADPTILTVPFCAAPWL